MTPTTTLEYWRRPFLSGPFVDIVNLMVSRNTAKKSLPPFSDHELLRTACATSTGSKPGSPD